MTDEQITALDRGEPVMRIVVRDDPSARMQTIVHFACGCVADDAVGAGRWTVNARLCRDASHHWSACDEPSFVQRSAAHLS